MHQEAACVADQADLRGSTEVFLQAGSAIRVGLKAARLRRVGEQLLALNEETAGEFLRAGARLQEAAGRTRMIMTLASDASAAAAGSDQGDDRLHRMAEVAGDTVSKLREWQRELDQIPDNLGAVVNSIQSVMAAGVEWHRSIAKNLRVVRMYTAVEAAHLNSHNSRVEAFCVELAESADHISNDGAAWKRRTAEATVSLDSAHRSITEGVSSFAAGVADAQRQLSTALSGLSGILARSRESTEQVAAIAADISAQVNEVVASLQFHDIARQRIEHVQEALVEVAEVLEGYADDPQGADLDAVSHAYATLRLQGAQLEKVVEGAREAETTISGGLQRIASECIGLAAATESLRLAQGGDAFAQVRECVDALSVSLNHGSELAMDTVSSVQDVADIAAETDRWAERSRATSDELLMLGMNAVIMTANLREQGRTITVCADEIGRLVRASAETISDASGRLGSIVETAEELGRRTEQARQSHAARCEGDREELAQGLATLEAIHEHVKEAGETAELAARELADDIANTLAGLRFADTMRRKLEHSVSQIREAEQVLSDAGLQSAEGADLSHLAGRYTMADERHTHADILGAEAAPSLVLIDDDGACEGDGDELGDNVELF